MHTLARNTQTFFYALYQGEQKKYDEDGNYTGQKELTYSDPIKADMNISPSLGRAELESFGVNASYTHTIVTDNLNCPMDEYSIIWYGVAPTEKHNFVVVRKAKTLNHIIYALQEVNGDVRTST